MKRRIVLTIAGFGLVALATCLLAPLVGSTHISILRAFDRSIPFADNVDAQVFFVARLPRVIAAALVGAAFALAGVVFQALLRNPLASPDTLGVSAGATLGAIIVIAFHLDVSTLGISAIPVASFAGSIGAFGIIYLLSIARRRGTSTTVLLLAGVAITALLSAVNRFVTLIADFTDTFRSVRWMMGALDVGSYREITAALVPMAIAFGIILTLPRVLDLISLGSEAAAFRGVDVKRAERLALIGASLSTGAAVSLGGPIPFVGIIVPHMVRLMVGADHRIVLPASALAGGVLLMIADLASRVALAPRQLPVGALTALVGVPLFLVLMQRERR